LLKSGIITVVFWFFVDTCNIGVHVNYFMIFRVDT